MLCPSHAERAQEACEGSRTESGTGGRRRTEYTGGDTDNTWRGATEWHCPRCGASSDDDPKTGGCEATPRGDRHAALRVDARAGRLHPSADPAAPSYRSASKRCQARTRRERAAGQRQHPTYRCGRQGCEGRCPGSAPAACEKASSGTSLRRDREKAFLPMLAGTLILFAGCKWAAISAADPTCIVIREVAFLPLSPTKPFVPISARSLRDTLRTLCLPATAVLNSYCHATSPEAPLHARSPCAVLTGHGATTCLMTTSSSS